MASANLSERLRSPRYPSHSLQEALGYARKLYEAVHRSHIDSNTAVRVMGFAGKSGASASALGSVRQYGLIEGVGDNTRISGLGLQILEPSTPAEYSQNLRVAAFAPQVFSAISERFSGKIPSVDDPIRSYLIRDLGFSKSGATDCVKSLRETLDFIGGQVGDSGADSAESSMGAVDQVPVSSPVSSPLHLIDPSVATQARFPLTRDCYAELTVYGEIGPKALENLKRQIAFLTDVWAE